MKNTKRALATLALAGVALTMSGTAHAETTTKAAPVADPKPGGVAAALPERPSSPLSAIPLVGGLLGGGAAAKKSDGLLGLPLPV
ncbi:hypothetical protein ACFU6S_30920 [Streptomyces sp. NPDC057456]|uniref:hypothetical protein n=1 Tax=Streptomyces sp. NPDC057456 TaxID=3346139 RepID=UPI0036B92529